jgi:iron complex outermembrane receptor protein
MGNGISLRAALGLSCSLRALGLFAGFGLAVGAAPALAQTSAGSTGNANAPVNLDLGAVLANGTSSAGSDYQDTPGAAPYEAPSTAPLNSVQPTSLVNQNTIQNQLTSSESYADIARLTPSVNNIDPNGPGLMESNGPTIRGFQDGQYNVTFDGIPIGDSNDFTHHTTSFFTNDEIGEEIIDRGPGTAETVGDATFGGTISIRTINPAAQTTLTPYGSYGSYNTGVEGLRVDTGAVQAADGTSAVFNFEHIGSDGALQNATQERTNFFGKVVVPVSDNTTVTFMADYNRLYQNPSIGATTDEMGYYGYNFAYTDDPTQQNDYRYNNDHITTDMEYVDVESHLNGGWEYDGKLYTYAYYHEDLNGDDVNDQGIPGQFTGSPETVATNLIAAGAVPNQVELTPGGPITAGVPGQVFKNTYRSVGTIQRVQKDFDWGDIKFGAWFDHQVNSRYVQDVSLTNGNAINYDLDDSNGGKGTIDGGTAQAPGYDNDLGSIERLQHNQLYTFQPYAQFDYSPITNLTLTGGVKYAFFRRALNAQVQQKTELPTGYSHDWGKFLPSVEAKYDFAPGLSAYAQFAEGFLAPNLNTFYTNNIAKDAYAPEETYNYQTGLEYQDQHLALGADVYLVHFMNYIASKADPTEPGSANDIFYNAGGAIYKGIEGEAAYTFDSGFTFFANGGLNQSNYTATNDYVDEAPQFTANGGIIYNKNGFYASAIDEVTGGEYGGAPALGSNPREPGQWYDPYNVVNLSMGYTFNSLYPHMKQLTVKVNADNITNQTQIIFDDGTNGMGQPLYYTLTGASVFLSVSMPLTF